MRCPIGTILGLVLSIGTALPPVAPEPACPPIVVDAPGPAVTHKHAAKPLDPWWRDHWNELPIDWGKEDFAKRYPAPKYGTRLPENWGKPLMAPVIVLRQPEHAVVSRSVYQPRRPRAWWWAGRYFRR